MQKRLKIIATLAAAAFATIGDAANIPQEWAVEVSRVKQYQFQANRGDTMELKATYWHNGEPFDLGGDTFRLYWQTNAMGSVYWSAPATAASNTVSAVFANTMDPGAPIVYGFLGATSGNYRASFSIRYAPGPGAVPNALPLPAATIDFAKVEVLNPPYYTKAETEEKIIELSPVPDLSAYATKEGLAAAASSGTNYTDLATDALSQSINSNLSTNYYTATETDDAIDALAAYYITANAAGDAFPTYAALTNATVYYSGGEARTPTRNDYAVVLADETHGGAEWRYIYAVHSAGDPGQWEAQYPIETNDYEGLSNKPQINGHTLTNNLTGDSLGLLGNSGNQALNGLLRVYLNEYKLDREVLLVGSKTYGLGLNLRQIIFFDNGIQYTIEVPPASGTLALLSDIPTVPSLSGQTFNFATTQGVMDALKTVIEALGGTVTNAPSTATSQGE